MPRRTYKQWSSIEPPPHAPSTRTQSEVIAVLVARGEITEEEAAALWAGDDSPETRARYQQQQEHTL